MLFALFLYSLCTRARDDLSVFNSGVARGYFLFILGLALNGEFGRNRSYCHTARLLSCMGILNNLLAIPIKAGYTCPMKCKYFRFMLEVFSMKLSFFGACACYVLMPRACSSGEAPSVPEEPTTAVPEYSFINSDRYVQNGTTGIGYRVAIGDGATEEEMRAVFGNSVPPTPTICTRYGFTASRATSRTSARFSVGMLEEKNLAARARLYALHL